jgi:hypothetical protein
MTEEQLRAHLRVLMRVSEKDARSMSIKVGTLPPGVHDQERAVKWLVSSPTMAQGAAPVCVLTWSGGQPCLMYGCEPWEARDLLGFNPV